VHRSAIEIAIGMIANYYRLRYAGPNVAGPCH
jgi:hypothetical protein